MTVCPCCGSRFEGDLRAGCPGCGARAVGEPLARPEHELPSYGRALLVGASGAALSVAFLASALLALRERTPLSFGMWSIAAAAETAAWRLKWLALPALVFALWGGAAICISIRATPARFAGRRIAYAGLAATTIVALMFVTFIGITVPARLRQRQWSIDAAREAQIYTIERALLQYRQTEGTYPASISDLRAKLGTTLPDQDGSIAAALAGLSDDAYKPSAELAFGNVGKSRGRPLRRTALRHISLTAAPDVGPPEGVPFTSYELRLPGEDYKANPKDEWIVRDGVIARPSETIVDHAPIPPGDTKAP